MHLLPTASWASMSPHDSDRFYCTIQGTLTIAILHDNILTFKMIEIYIVWEEITKVVPLYKESTNQIKSNKWKIVIRYRDNFLGETCLGQHVHTCEIFTNSVSYTFVLSPTI